MRRMILVLSMLLIATVVLPACGQVNPIPTESPEVETPKTGEKGPAASVPETPGTTDETPIISPLEILPGTGLPSSSYLPEVPRIGIEEVKAKLDAGSNIMIVDSRSKASYDRSHIAVAISIPLADMAGPYSDLASYDEIIFYCT